MKNAFTLSALFFALASSAQLHYNQPARLIDHMLEVNAEWVKHVDNPEYEDMIFFQSEDDRIQRHLLLVIAEIRAEHACSSSPGDPVCELMAQLEDYALFSEFPRNINQAERIPHFIDDRGVHCAVGYLMQQNGYADLAQTVHNDMNLAYVREIALSSLASWMSDSKLSVDEMAWIQPGYPPSTLWSNHGDGVSGLILDMVEWNGQLYIGGQFQLDGVPHTLAVFNGTDFESAAFNPDGIIQDLAVHNGDLVAAGAFLANTTFFRFTGSEIFYETVGLSKNPLGYELLVVGDDLYLAEDASGFIEMYAVFKAGEEDWELLANTNRLIRTLEWHDDKLMMGGDFDLLYLPSGGQVDANYVAQFDGSEWTPVGDGLPTYVFDLTSADGQLLACGYLEDGGGEPIFGTANWTGEAWNVHDWTLMYFQSDFNPYFTEIEFASGEWYISGYCQMGSGLYFGEGVGHLFVNEGTVVGVDAMVPSPVTSVVRCLEPYENRLYAAGDFFAGELLNNVISTQLPSDIEEGTLVDLNIWPVPAGNNLNLDIPQMPGNLSLEIRNVAGQLVRTESLQAAGKARIDVHELSPGTYYLSLIEDRRLLAFEPFVKH